MANVDRHATQALARLPRLSEVPPGHLRTPGSKVSLLMPTHIDLQYTTHDTVRTHGLGEVLDSQDKELVSIVRIVEPLSVQFEDLRILTPRVYAHSLDDGAPHVVAQAVVYVIWDESAAPIVSELIERYEYGDTTQDLLWQSRTEVGDIRPGEICLVMNRRIGGWDGSPDRPVIELLAGGGHVKTVWVDSAMEFQMQSIMDTLRQELDEELGFTARDEDFSILGGFLNQITNELVVLAALRIEPTQLVPMQEHAYGNLAENVDGIYIGPFDEVMTAYHQNASHFAGGERSRPTNFPSDAALMKAIRARFGILG